MDDRRCPLGRALRDARARTGLSQRSLAAHLGLSRTAISNIEAVRPDLQRKGLRRLRLQHYRRLAALIGWTTEAVVQQKMLASLAHGLERRRMETGMSHQGLAIELDGRLTPREVARIEAGERSEELMRLTTRSLVMAIAASLAWMPRELTRADLDSLPRRIPASMAFGRAAWSSYGTMSVPPSAPATGAR